mmetsp:Transcript_19254/g.66776  ORF Transcript_19254/g.66776 Transcript_19254/m.66776 type:complete len:212 (-) Transcript_19254:762-1397(-)
MMSRCSRSASSSTFVVTKRASTSPSARSSAGRAIADLAARRSRCIAARRAFSALPSRDSRKSLRTMSSSRGTPPWAQMSASHAFSPPRPSAKMSSATVAAWRNKMGTSRGGGRCDLRSAASTRSSSATPRSSMGRADASRSTRLFDAASSSVLPTCPPSPRSKSRWKAGPRGARSPATSVGSSSRIFWAVTPSSWSKWTRGQPASRAFEIA